MAKNKVTAQSVEDRLNELEKRTAMLTRVLTGLAADAESTIEQTAFRGLSDIAKNAYGDVCAIRAVLDADESRVILQTAP